MWTAAPFGGTERVRIDRAEAQRRRVPLGAEFLLRPRKGAGSNETQMRPSGGALQIVLAFGMTFCFARATLSSAVSLRETLTR